MNTLIITFILLLIVIVITLTNKEVLKSFYKKSYNYLSHQISNTLIIKDSNSEYNRLWQRRIVFGSNLFLFVGYEIQLIQFQGKPTPPRPVRTWHLGFYKNFNQWKVEQVHIWYDGPHCSYQFGPFIYQKSAGDDCPRCRDEI